MVIAPNQPVLSAPVEGLSGDRGGAVGGRGGVVGSAESGLPVVECAAAGVVVIMAGSSHKLRALVPYVTRLRVLRHERPYLMLRAASGGHGSREDSLCARRSHWQRAEYAQCCARGRGARGRDGIREG